MKRIMVLLFLLGLSLAACAPAAPDAAEAPGEVPEASADSPTVLVYRHPT